MTKEEARVKNIAKKTRTFVNSAKGKASLKKAAKRVNQTAIDLEAKSRLDPKQLDEPATL